MIKMFINDEEVVSNKEFTINEEMLATSSTILNNCYPKTWEDIKDYTSKFYYPKDYSRCIIGKGDFKYGNNRYAKLTASGIDPSFDTNTEKPLDTIIVDGKSTQETRSGKNLLNLKNKIDGTINGITIATNKDGSLKVNGTTVGANDLMQDRRIKVGELEPGTYNFAGRFDGSSGLTHGNNGVYLRQSYFHSNYVYLNLENDITIAKTFTLTEKTEMWIQWFCNTANVEIDGNLYLWVEKGSIATDYEPYGVMPSPDYPSEVECVKGKNLLPEVIDKTTQTKNGITLTFLENNKINLKGTSTEITRFDLPLKESTKITKDIYAHFRNNATGNASIGFLNDSGQFGWYSFDKINVISKLSGVSFESSEINKIRFFINAGATIDITFQPSLEYTPDTTRYVPYNNLQVINTGKNIEQGMEQGGIGSSGGNYSSTTAIRSKYFNMVKPNTTYALSMNGSTNGFNVAQYDENKNFISFTYYYGKITTAGNTRYIRISKTATLNDEIQIEEGETVTSYEPCQSQILNIDLQGNELCSIGDAKDELIIKNGRAKIIKRIGKAIFNGSETINTVINNRFQIQLTLLASDGYNNVISMCDKLVSIPQIEQVSTTKENVISVNGNYAYIRLTSSATLAEFKNWLSTNNTTVYYQLAEEQEIDLGEVNTLNTYDGVNNISLNASMNSNMEITYLYENYGLLFCGIVKNSGNISLNPRYPHYGAFEILDFKTFLSESDTLDFVISDKTITEAIEMVIDAIAMYGFILGDIKIFGADDVIGAYSTQNKTPYDVFQYLTEITGSRWYTRVIDEDTIAIDFYDTTLLPRGDNIEYNETYFENKNVVDLSFNYGSRDYRNKQVILSDEIYASIDYTEIILSNGYQTVFTTENNIGVIKSIYIDGEEKTFATNNQKDTGIDAEFYYTPGKNTFESDGDTYSAGTQITLTYTPLVRGRQVVYNNDEVARIHSQTGRKGVIARYETRNDILSSKELDMVAQSYIKYKGSPEVILTLIVEDEDIYNIGQAVYFDSPISDLAQDYMVKTKKTRVITTGDSKKVFFTYELTSSFNAEKEINYFDNQRSKNKGNISVGETITRNIDIENTANIIFKEMSFKEVAVSGDNVLNSALNSPFIS